MRNGNTKVFIEDGIRRVLYKLLEKYKIQLENIKQDSSRLKMKESLFNKIGQVLFLHVDNWRNNNKLLVAEDCKSREIQYAERHIGCMGEKSTIELVKPFGFDYLTEMYLTDYIAIRKQMLKCSPAGSDILDLGCGGGWLATFLSYEGYNVDGIEISPILVDMAQKRYEAWHSDGQCAFWEGDIERLKTDKKYDGVIIYEALHHTQMSMVTEICASFGH